MQENAKRPAELIIVYETPLKSWLVDASTFAMVAGMIGLGWLFDSAAMQWLAFVVIAIMAITVAVGKSDRKMTVAQARKRLDEIEQEMSA